MWDRITKCKANLGKYIFLVEIRIRNLAWIFPPFLHLEYFQKRSQKKSFKGYGQSTGRPSEKNLYADIAAALKALETKCQIPPERVILYGQSIGTVPSGFF